MENFFVFVSLLIMMNFCDQKSNDIQLRNQDNDKNVDIPLQAEVRLLLDVTPGTGFRWSVAAIDSTLLRQLGDSFFKNESQRFGSKDLQIFSFKPLRTGSARLELIYHRTWEKNVAPRDTFSVTLNIINTK